MKKLFSFIILILFYFFGLSQQDQIISEGNIFDGEPYLAIDPLNSQHFVVAWMSFQFQEAVVIRSKTSWNAGQSWSDAVFIPHVIDGHTSADVSMQYDLNGNLFLAFIDYNSDTGETGAVYVSKSLDGGLSWNQPVEAISVSDCPNQLCIDRPWMVIDRSDGVNQGNIYVTTTNATLYNVTPPYHPFLVVSTDHGLSFSPPTTIDEGDFAAGNIISQPVPSPTLGADGTLHIVYPAYVLSQNLSPRWIHASSSNAGSDFNYHEVYVGGNGFFDNLPKTGALLISNPNNANNLAFFVVRAESSDPDIYVTESFDQGVSWSTMQRVNDDEFDNGVTQDLVWADFDSQGNLAVCWRDRRDAVDSGYEVPSKIYGTWREANSDQIIANFEVSSQEADHHNVLNGAGNDFMCVKLVDDTLNAVWGDVRSGTLSIYLNRISMEDGTNEIIKIASENLPQLAVLPNPCTDNIVLVPMKNNCKYQILSEKGEKALSGIAFPQKKINTSSLSPGTYFIKIKNQTQNQLVKFIKL